MLKVTIVALGSIKESYFREAIEEYTKRLQAFVQLEIKELKDVSFSDKDNKDMVKAKEAETIIAAIPRDSYVIALDENGTQFTSEEFAKRIEAIKLQSSHVVFIIGGTLGLDPSVFEHINLKLSLSKNTLTHQMVRVFLLEQIYRIQMISSGKPYHY